MAGITAGGRGLVRGRVFSGRPECLLHPGESDGRPDEVGGEGGGGGVHDGVDVVGAGGEEFDGDVGDEAVADAVGDGEGGGDRDQGDEGGDGGVEFFEVDAGGLFHHQEADED